MSGYAIRESLEHEREEVVQLMLDHYATSEPSLALFLKKNERRLAGAGMDTVRSDLRRRYDAMLRNFACLVAVCPHTRRIVGANVMNVEENPSLPARELDRLYEDVMDPVPIESGPLAEYYRHVIAAAEADVDFFRMFPQRESARAFKRVSIPNTLRISGIAKAILFDGENRTADEVVDSCWKKLANLTEKLSTFTNLLKCHEKHAGNDRRVRGPGAPQPRPGDDAARRGRHLGEAARHRAGVRLVHVAILEEGRGKSRLPELPVRRQFVHQGS